MWWGFSPALDLLDEYGPPKPGTSDEGNKEEERAQAPEVTEATESGDAPEASESGDKVTYNMLLVGQYDNRHVLKTLAQKYRHHGDVTVKMYVVEPLLENVARDLMFVTLALEPPENMGLAEKTRTFMELYGNTLIRPSANNYLKKVSARLMHMITNFNYAATILPSVSLDSLKYKERDQLETIFKYWGSEDNTFDIINAWDQRIRKALGQRYDLRVGVFDWDYHMRYRPYGADVLSAYEYKKFRERGMSFYYEDTDPSIPNRSILSGICSSGSKVNTFGYMGDIVTGPYVAFGFDCEDEEMLKKVNGYNKKTCTDITERNVMRIFHEIQNRNPFVPIVVEEEATTPVVVVEDTSKNLKISRQESSRNLGSSSARMRDLNDTYTSVPIDQCEVIFLPTTALKDYPLKPHFENFFDFIYMPQQMVFKHFTTDILKMFKPKSKILVDTPKYALNFRKEDLEKFKNDLEELMAQCNCEPISSYDFKKDEFVRFQVVK